MPDPIMHCCFIPCDAPAEWELRDGSATDDYTHACTAHVGALLTGEPTTVTHLAAAAGPASPRSTNA